MTIPFTFYWANETETTFNPSTMNVLNEEIVTFDIGHEEGQVPTLDIVVKNPRIGLLAPGRKVWAWFGWYNPAHSAYEPLFFGVLVGVPTSLFQEKIMLKFIARSPTFIQDKQALAETMKTSPYYDPVWIETGKRDDPDTILEGWSSVWHIDRLTNVITHSDMLVGEDGTTTFLSNEALYNSVSLELGQPPLTNIRVEATTNWTQRSSGFITDVPVLNISSYTGDTLISDWPKPGGAIGGGYKCEASYIIDTYFVSETPQFSQTISWKGGNISNPGQCSDSSTTNSASGPALLAPHHLEGVLTAYSVTGICDPFGDPPDNPPVNRPSSFSVTGIIVPEWNVSMSMTLRYDSSRAYSEVLAFDMTANTQALLASPTVSQNTELITISSVDVGQPLFEVEAWSDFTNAAVGLAQIIFPNNPTTPGGLSYQICVTAGTAGSTEPVFSDVIGTTTTDGTVVWSSMGGSPLTSAATWSPASYVPLGEIMLLQNQVFNPASGDFEDVPGESVFYICTSAGKTNSVYTTFSYTPPVLSNVEPTPAVKFIDYIKPPAFRTDVGGQVYDGPSGSGTMTLLGDYPIGGSGEGVTWTVLGVAPALLGIPIGGTADNVTARSYFPTDRGLQSVEYLISKARARLRFRARAVTVGWECPFALATGLSCRMNATLLDPRLPGGAASGKVISYHLTGGSGKFRGNVKIGCAIGFGGGITNVVGTPEYAASGYMQAGYQIMDGATVSHGSDETSYTLPVFAPFDDGLIFPLTWNDISDGGIISGNLTDQAAVIQKSFSAAATLAWYSTYYAQPIPGTVFGPGSTETTGLNAQEAWVVTREQLTLAAQNTPYVMAANSISWTCLLKPCNGNGPFGGSYNIIVSPLVVPQGINLEAPSNI